MSGPLMGVGAAAGVSLILLLIVTRLNADFRLWPTPRPWSWQSILFWSLFRALNISTLALAALDWQPWTGAIAEAAGGHRRRADRRGALRPWLEAAYGKEYRDYRRRVARFYNWRHGLNVLQTELSRLERALKEARL